MSNQSALNLRNPSRSPCLLGLKSITSTGTTLESKWGCIRNPNLISTKPGLAACRLSAQTSSESPKIDKGKMLKWVPWAPYGPCTPKGELTESKPMLAWQRACKKGIFQQAALSPREKQTPSVRNLHILAIFLKMSLSTNANNSNQTKLDQIKDAQV